MGVQRRHSLTDPLMTCVLFSPLDILLYLSSLRHVSRHHQLSLLTLCFLSPCTLLIRFLAAYLASLSFGFSLFDDSVTCYYSLDPEPPNFPSLSTFSLVSGR